MISMFTHRVVGCDHNRVIAECDRVPCPGTAKAMLRLQLCVHVHLSCSCREEGLFTNVLMEAYRWNFTNSNNRIFKLYSSWV